jgi:hypothetical protein
MEQALLTEAKSKQLREAMNNVQPYIVGLNKNSVGPPVVIARFLELRIDPQVGKSRTVSFSAPTALAAIAVGHGASVVGSRSEL